MRRKSNVIREMSLLIGLAQALKQAYPTPTSFADYAPLPEDVSETYFDSEGQRNVTALKGLYKRATDGAKSGRMTVATFQNIKNILEIKEPGWFNRLVSEGSFSEERLKLLRKAVAIDEERAHAYLNEKDPENCGLVIGSIIELRNFYFSEMSDGGRGVPLGGVDIDEGDIRFINEPSLEIGRFDPEEKSGRKYCLNGIKPEDTLDAWGGRVRLSVAHTEFKNVVTSDPAVLDEHAVDGSNPPKYLLNIDEVRSYRKQNVPRDNRIKYGSLEPRSTRIPYSLTLFFTIILRDRKVLLMEKRPDAAWYPGMIDLGGGEGLSVADIKGSSYGENAFERWLNRAVCEEYFPAKALSDQEKGAVIQKFVSEARLYSIGFCERDCSFPLFAMVQSRCDEQEYLSIIHDIRRRYPGTSFDKEGSLGVMHVDELATFLKGGKGEARRLLIRSKLPENIQSVEQISAAARLKFLMDRSRLHPMTPYRIRLIFEALAVQRV